MIQVDLYDNTLEEKILALPYSSQVNLDDGRYIFIPESDYGFAEIFRLYDDYLFFLIPTYGGTPSLYKSVHSHAVKNVIEELRKMT